MITGGVDHVGSSSAQSGSDEVFGPVRGLEQSDRIAIRKSDSDRNGIVMRESILECITILQELRVRNSELDTVLKEELRICGIEILQKIPIQAFFRNPRLDLRSVFQIRADEKVLQEIRLDFDFVDRTIERDHDDGMIQFLQSGSRLPEVIIGHIDRELRFLQEFDPLRLRNAGKDLRIGRWMQENPLPLRMIVDDIRREMLHMGPILV